MFHSHCIAPNSLTTTDIFSTYISYGLYQPFSLITCKRNQRWILFIIETGRKSTPPLGYSPVI